MTVATVFGDEGGIAMTLIGNIGEFVESHESWTQCIERMEQFFTANDIPNAKKVPVLLATVGPAVFHIMGNLVTPAKPSTKSFVKLVSVMSDFYNPKPLVTVQRTVVSVNLKSRFLSSFLN